jgi:hypothetical protein
MTSRANVKHTRTLPHEVDKMIDVALASLNRMSLILSHDSTRETAKCALLKASNYIWLLCQSCSAGSTKALPIGDL